MTVDPLREALERIANQSTGHYYLATTGRVSDDGSGRPWKHWAEIAREALAAAPVEPEEGEWRVLLDNYPHALDDEEHARREIERCRDMDFGDRPAPVFERRHPGTAPGPWERVQ